MARSFKGTFVVTSVMEDIVSEAFQFDNLLSFESDLVNCLILIDETRFRRATENYAYGNQRGCDLDTRSFKYSGVEKHCHDNLSAPTR